MSANDEDDLFGVSNRMNAALSRGRQEWLAWLTTNRSNSVVGRTVLRNDGRCSMRQLIYLQPDNSVSSEALRYAYAGAPAQYTGARPAPDPLVDELAQELDTKTKELQDQECEARILREQLRFAHVQVNARSERVRQLEDEVNRLRTREPAANVTTSDGLVLNNQQVLNLGFIGLDAQALSSRADTFLQAEAFITVWRDHSRSGVLSPAQEVPIKEFLPEMVARVLATRDRWQYQPALRNQPAQQGPRVSALDVRGLSQALDTATIPGAVAGSRQQPSQAAPSPKASKPKVPAKDATNSRWNGGLEID